MSQIVVDNYRDFMRALRTMDADVKKEIRAVLRTAANDIARDAKANASFSTGKSGHGAIPSAIGVSMTQKYAAIVIKRKTPAGPHAGLFERGSRGNRGVIRHKLFGDPLHWYSTQTRPFIKPAVDKGAPQLIRALDEAIGVAKRKAGF